MRESEPEGRATETIQGQGQRGKGQTKQKQKPDGLTYKMMENLQ